MVSAEISLGTDEIVGMMHPGKKKKKKSPFTKGHSQAHALDVK